MIIETEPFATVILNVEWIREDLRAGFAEVSCYYD
jgi:hypothetical protein